MNLIRPAEQNAAAATLEAILINLIWIIQIFAVSLGAGHPVLQRPALDVADDPNNFVIGAVVGLRQKEKWTARRDLDHHIPIQA